MDVEGALKYWCPMARIEVRHIKDSLGQVKQMVTYNRNEPHSNCLGRECACWREDIQNTGHCGLAVQS